MTQSLDANQVAKYLAMNRQPAPTPAADDEPDVSNQPAVDATESPSQDPVQDPAAYGRALAQGGLAQQSAPSPNAFLRSTNVQNTAAQGARNLVVAPQANAGPTETPGGPTAGDRALSAFLNMGSSHQVGLGATDKAYLESLRQQAADTGSATRDALEQNRGIASDFAKQTDAVTQQSAIATEATQQQIRDNDAHRAALMAETKQKQAQITSRLNELEAQGVNPNHYWQEQSTGSKVLAGIAVGLGGLAAGLNAHLGGHNAALDIINGAIERDVDAQKTNLMARLSLLDKRMGANAQGFEQQDALLKSERDSVQTSYAIAQNELSKKLAAYKDNTDLQQRGAQLGAALTASAQDRVGRINEQIYSLKKRGEQVIGGGNKIAEYIKAHTDEVIQKAAANGVTLTVPQAQAYLAQTQGLNVPGTSEVPSLAKAPKGPQGQAAGQIASLDGAIENVQQLLQMRQNAGVIRGPEANAKANALAFETRAQIAKGLGARMSPELLSQFSRLVPDDPLEHNAAGLVGADPTAARLQMALQSLQRQRAAIQANPGSASEPDDNPAGGTPEAD